MPRRSKEPETTETILRRCQKELTELVRAFCSGHPAVMLAVAAGVAAGYEVFREKIVEHAMSVEVMQMDDVEPGEWVLG